MLAGMLAVYRVIQFYQQTLNCIRSVTMIRNVIIAKKGWNDDPIKNTQPITGGGGLIIDLLL